MRKRFLTYIFSGVLLFLFFAFFAKSSYAISCSPPISNDTPFTISQSCVFSNNFDGVDAGTGTNNTATMIIQNVALTVGGIQGGQTIGYGVINLQGTASINIVKDPQPVLLKKAPIWVQDADGDRYPAAAYPTYDVRSTQQNSTYVRRNTLTTVATADCNDSDNTKYQYLTGYPNGSSTPTQVCSGNSLPAGYTTTPNYPNCDITPSCSVGCSVQCGSGTQSSCAYTAYSGSGTCNQVSAPNQPCAPTCTSPQICSGNTCINPTCDIGAINCTACSASCNGGSQTCTHNAYSGGGSCTPANFSQSCNTQTCPCNAGAVYGACSASCNGGTQSCTYTTLSGGGSCTQTSCGNPSCNTQTCPCNAGAVYGACSVVCGTGSQTCTYTTYSGGGSCTQTSCGNPSCSPTCSYPYTCSANQCIPQSCNSGLTCTSCSASCGGGTRDCTYTTYNGSTPCYQNGYSQSCNTQTCTQTWKPLCDGTNLRSCPRTGCSNPRDVSRSDRLTTDGVVIHDGSWSANYACIGGAKSGDGWYHFTAVNGGAVDLYGAKAFFTWVSTP